MGDGWRPYWAWFSGSSAHLQIWKVRLCCMKNINKMAKKLQKKSGWLSLLVMDGYCFRVQYALPNIEKNALLDEKWQ